MRLWHQSLIPYLDRQHLLGQHRECCALRGNGWGKKHSTVDYVFKYSKDNLVFYHQLVIAEMERRGYFVNPKWKEKHSHAWAGPVFPEHNRTYLFECIDLLKQKQAPMDFEKIERELL